LADSIIANTPTGIVTSLLAENSTSFLLQNVGFFGVQTAISDSSQNQVLLAGVPGGARVVDSWGFGMVNNATNGMATFTNAGYMTPMPRKPELTGKQYDQMQPNLFTRRRPKYYDVPANKVINVKAFGAMGDGVTDDTAVLNGILQGAANTSSVVFFPFGIYIVRDTLRIPVGSRVIGQSWSQIMGTGSKFADELHPRPVVQVGRPGDAGILEIQDMMFTVKGATAGAIVVQWNVRETTTGSAGLWGMFFFSSRPLPCRVNQLTVHVPPRHPCPSGRSQGIRSRRRKVSQADRDRQPQLQGGVAPDASDARVYCLY
jgi:hypothetical protein